MYRVVSCLATQHDYRLVLLAALICGAAAFASFRIYSHVVASHGLRRLGLLLLTGLCSGAGIWATHFVAMLAYEPGMPTAYEPVATTASLLIAVVATTVGFATSSCGSDRWAGVGGALIGTGIAAMHYSGMGALMVPGTLAWDLAPVAASLVIGIALAAAAMITYHRSNGRQGLWISAGLLTLAICGLHFTAMGAVTILPDPTIVVRPSRIDDTVMAFAVAGATLLITLSGITSTALMENQTRRQREEELRCQNLRFDAALTNMGEGLCMFDAQKRLVICNDRYAKLYQLPPGLLKVGTPHSAIIAHRVLHGILKGETNDGAVKQKISTLGELPRDASSARVDELSDGRLICVTRQPMEGGGWVATHDDVTEQRRSEAKITHMAQHDALTDLPNRLLLRDRLEQALATTRRRHHFIAILMLDLDRFKEINDTLGHSVGDVLLKAVADRLRSCVREGTTIARLGGDEFAVIEDVADAAVEATALAERLQTALSAPFELGDHQVTVGSSIGIAVAPSDGSDPDQLLKNADLALYRAKSDGRGAYRFFEPEMDARMRERRALERDLRKALTRGEFELYYQPFVNLQRNEVCGFEALLRWHHPERGMVPPGEFIAVAEETGLIVPIGEWVIRTACAEAATWPGYIRVAVNLSPAQFKSKTLVQVVFNALTASGLPGRRLELEITESALLENNAATLATVDQLRAHGIQIAMDDFGTGYSSLGYLQNFPFDKIKIDRSFINNLSNGAGAFAILKAITTLACSLDVTTIAEGVETQEQLEKVRALGCREMQGFLFSPARPASEIKRLFLMNREVVESAA